MMNYHFRDFTENNYRKLLRLAKKKYSFIPYSAYKEIGKKILWRHDVDISIHRAKKMASIEFDEGVTTTYFIHVHSIFYNTLEKEIYQLIQEILQMGHCLGLHFDPDFYGQQGRKIENLNKFVKFEKKFIQELLHTEISAISIHNPNPLVLSAWRGKRIAGMINTYSNYIMNNYSYCSDSNGYWRFRRLKDVLTAASAKNLQVLTHPEWWTPITMSPRERITRCIEGRAKYQHAFYDSLLDELDRENIK